MDELQKEIIEYKNKNKLSVEECANNLGLSIDDIKKIEDGESVQLSETEYAQILDTIKKNNISKGKRVIKILDLIFRFVAMVMALVTLLLCINENVDTKVLIVLLSIGLVCSSMTILPKIDK